MSLLTVNFIRADHIIIIGQVIGRLRCNAKRMDPDYRIRPNVDIGEGDE